MPHKKLFSKITALNNLTIAYKNAIKQKRFQKSILSFEKNLGSNLLRVQKQLRNKTYRHGSYNFFTIYEPKKREISAAPFKDRIVHHAVYQILEPIYDNNFIYDSYACRKGKGTHAAVKRLKKFLQSHYDKTDQTYALKCDVSKCFPSINHQILIKILQKTIKEQKLMWLLEEIISSYESDDRYNHLFASDSHFIQDRPRGIPIGNLTSQLFMNVYLNELDQFMKHNLRAQYYLRYVDDFIILHSSKPYLHQLTEKIRNFLSDELFLTLHPKKVRVFPVEQGVDFLGYVVFKNHIRLRSTNVKKFKKRLKKFKKQFRLGQISKDKIKASITSWLAHAQQADTYNLRKSIFGQPLRAEDQDKIEKFINSWRDREPSGQLHLFSFPEK